MFFSVTTGVSRRGPSQQDVIRAGLQRFQGLLHVVLIPTLLLSLAPLVLLLIDAGKSADQFEAHPWTLTLPYYFKNYWVMAGGMGRYILNSSIISGIAIPLALALASYTSYVFARFSFPGKETLFYAIIMLMMIPFVLYLVPQYLLVLSLGMMNTRWALIFPYAAGGAVFGVFLIRPFMAGLPEELFEAARIDGAGDWQVFYKIALPLCRPIMATLMIILLLGQWNDIIWPSVTLTSDKVYTVTLGIFSIAKSVFHGSSLGQTQWGFMFAAFVISSLPLVFVFTLARKAFIQGLSSGALKF